MAVLDKGLGEGFGSIFYHARSILNS